MNPSHAPVSPKEPLTSEEPVTSNGLVTPEGFIVSKDLIASENLIASEGFIASKSLIASEGLVISENSVNPEDNINNATHIILSKRLKYIMKDRKITSRQLADLIYVSESTISGYLSGRRLPDLERVRLICVDLEVSADYLLGLRSDPYIYH